MSYSAPGFLNIVKLIVRIHTEGLLGNPTRWPQVINRLTSSSRTRLCVATITPLTINARTTGVHAVDYHYLTQPRPLPSGNDRVGRRQRGGPSLHEHAVGVDRFRGVYRDAGAADHLSADQRCLGHVEREIHCSPCGTRRTTNIIYFGVHRALFSRTRFTWQFFFHEHVYVGKRVMRSRRVRVPVNVMGGRRRSDQRRRTRNDQFQDFQRFFVVDTLKNDGTTTCVH